MGWSITELATYLGKNDRTIYRWEAGNGGKSGIPMADAARLCDLFGVSLDHLMCRDECPNCDDESGAA